MKQYLHTIMRSLCIMVMLCGMSNSAWAQEAAEQWAGALGLDYNEGLGTSESDAFVIDEGHWGAFVENVGTIETTDLYFKLGTNLTIDECSTSWTPISGFEGYFDGNNQSISMKNCTFDTSTLFDGEADMINNSRISNMSYQYTFTTYAGLKELSDHLSEWPTLSYDTKPSFTIDTSEGDIEIEDDDWTAIDDSAIDGGISFSGSNFIVFPSTPVSTAYDRITDSDYRFVVTSETGFNTSLYKYKKLTIDDESDVTSCLSANSDLCVATDNWTLTDDLDFSSESSISTVTIGGTFNQNDHTITMPDFKANESPLEAFSGVEGVTYTYENILIEGDEDLNSFLSNQENLAKYSTTVKVSSDSGINAGYWQPIDSKFEITGDGTITVTIDSQAGIESIVDDINVFNDSHLEIVLESNSSKSDDWKDYDLSSKDLSGNNTITISNDLSSEVIILLGDKSYGHEPFSGNYYLNYLYSPSYKLVDALFNNIVSTPLYRGQFFTDHVNEEGHFIDAIANFAGHGTEDSPYLIYSYEMLKALVKWVNEQGEDYDTQDLHIQLASDINAQGNERLTGIDGTITLSGYEQNTLQFPEGFKGHFDGNKHSIGGMTQPLFSSLDGATIENIGIVDCYMSDPALATSASNSSTITNSYVSGVSAGLIPSSDITATDCYAWNTSTDTYTEYSINAETVADISGTHNILKDNCYELKSGVYSDCTLFIPEDNTFYEVSPSNSIFKWDSSASSESPTYMYYCYLGSGFVWIKNPLQSNMSMLHNVVYRDGWLNNNTDGSATNVGGLGSLDYLYSWYIVDKKACDVSALEKSSELGMCCRINNIYYSRNNASTTSPAPDGLNTIYLPFAWNPATDLYFTNNGEEEQIDDAVVYILADKLTDDKKFSDDAYYKDYSMEKSLLFFDPANTEAENSERYDDFAGVSNALPTLLEIPEGKSGWYIKRSELANYFTPRGDGGSYDKDAADAAGLDNLYNNYWEDQVHATEDNLKIGRSFMEIDRLGADWTNWGESDGSYSNYTRTVHYTCEDKGYGISGCDTQKQIYKTDADKTVCITDNGNNPADYSIYKANDDGDIAIEGDVKILTIYQAESIIDGSQRPLTIYQLDENGDKAQDESFNEISISTSEDDQIFLDSEGYPVKIILADGNVEINLTRESDTTTGEVISGSGTLHDNVLVEIGTDYPYYHETTSSDRIVVDNEGYPKKIILDYSSNQVEIDINRDGSSITGTVISGNYNSLKEGNKVVIYDNSSFYPLSFYVCGGHEEPEDCTWDGSDFPGRAYHLGTFKTIGKDNSDITFGAGTYTDTSDNVYSCYKLNSAGTGFAKVTATSTVQPFRTFFAIAPGPDPDADAGAKALSLGFCGIFDVNDIDDTPTQIDDAPVEGIKLMTTAQSRVYSLDGRYVGQYGQKKLARGMYIMNGKKFVVK